MLTGGAAELPGRALAFGGKMTSSLLCGEGLRLFRDSCYSGYWVPYIGRAFYTCVHVCLCMQWCACAYVCMVCVCVYVCMYLFIYFFMIEYVSVFVFLGIYVFI